MNSDEFLKIKNIYERKENDEIIGGVYFRPVEDKVTAVKEDGAFFSFVSSFNLKLKCI